MTQIIRHYRNRMQIKDIGAGNVVLQTSWYDDVGFDWEQREFNYNMVNDDVVCILIEGGWLAIITKEMIAASVKKNSEFRAKQKAQMKQDQRDPQDYTESPRDGWWFAQQ